MDKELVSFIQRRIWAFMIDHMLWMLIAVFVYWMLFDVYWMNEVGNKYQIAFLVAFSVYAIGMLLRDWKDGRSFGKRRLGLVVRGANDPLDRPGQVRLLIRNLLLVMLPLEFLMLWIRSGKRIGDEWSNTQVMFYFPDGAPGSVYQKKTPGIDASYVTQSQQAGNSYRPFNGFFDHLQFVPFVKKVSFFSGVAGGGVGLFVFILQIAHNAGDSDLIGLLVQNGLFCLLILPVGMIVFGALMAMLYYFPVKLFLKVMARRDGGR